MSHNWLEDLSLSYREALKLIVFINECNDQTDLSGDSRRIINAAKAGLSDGRFQYEQEAALQRIKWVCKHSVSSGAALSGSYLIASAALHTNEARERSYTELFLGASA